MKPYKPSNIVPSGSLIKLLLATMIGGTVVGGVTALIASIIYLIILFPALMGAAGAAIVGAIVHQGKVRNPLVAAGFGILAGLSIYGSLHYSQYLIFRRLVSSEIGAELGTTNQEQLDQIIDESLVELTGSDRFVGYIKYSAQEGVSVGQVGQDGISIGETGTWIYWLVEVLAITGISAVGAYGMASKPFCEQCDDWYGDRERLGSVPLAQSEQFSTFLQADNFTQAGALLNPLTHAYAPSWDVYLQHCPGSQAEDVILSTSEVSINHKGQFVLAPKLEGLISARQESQMQEAIATNLGVDLSTPQALHNFQQTVDLARQERSDATPNDRFIPHNLDSAQLTAFTQQLSTHKKIKTALLAQKELKHLPHQPLYVLGIERSGMMVSDKDLQTLRDTLIKELSLPTQTQVIMLNKQKALKTKLAEVSQSEIYST